MQIDSLTFQQGFRSTDSTDIYKNTRLRFMLELVILVLI
jgi:hypothetical protein